MLMEASLFDNESPIMDWLTNSMSESEPLMDEYDGFNHYSPAPAVVEVVQKRRKRKRRSVADLVDEEEDDEEEDEEEEEEEDEEKEEEEEEDDADTGIEAEDDFEKVPLRTLRKSTRKKNRSLKVLANLCEKDA